MRYAKRTSLAGRTIQDADEATERRERELKRLIKFLQRKYPHIWKEYGDHLLIETILGSEMTMDLSEEEKNLQNNESDEILTASDETLTASD